MINGSLISTTSNKQACINVTTQGFASNVNLLYKSQIVQSKETIWNETLKTYTNSFEVINYGDYILNNTTGTCSKSLFISEPTTYDIDVSTDVIGNIVWYSTSDPINYTYTSTDASSYLAVTMIGDGGGTINTTGTTTTELTTGTGSRHILIKLISCNANDTITFNVSNYSGGAYRGNNTYLMRLNYMPTYLNTFYSNRVVDTSFTATPTLLANKRYIVIQASCGSGRSSSRTIDASCIKSQWALDSMYFSSVAPTTDTKISLYQYCATAGGGVAYIIEIK